MRFKRKGGRFGEYNYIENGVESAEEKRNESE